MVRGHKTRKFGSVLSTTVESRIDGDFLFSNRYHFDLRGTLLIPSPWSGTEDGGFAESELKPTQKDGVEVISFDSRVDGHPIARTIAGLATLNDKGYAILNYVTGFWLGVDRPCRVKFVLVDDDLRGCRNNGGFVASEEPPWIPDERVAAS